MKALNQWPIYRKLLCWTNQHFPVLVCKIRYRRYFGRKMDLKNPRDINEKISWLELFTDTSLWTRCSDKYAVRGYVEEKGLSDILVKLYGKWDRATEIDWEKLPNKFVIKANNGSGTVMVVEDKNKLDFVKTTRMLDRWMSYKQSPTTTEFHYQGIKPCIIAEELLYGDEDERKWSTSIVDYKIWCFNGKVDCIWTCTNRTHESTEVALFDRNWNYRPEASIFNEHYCEQKHLTPRPTCLDEMIRVAEKLAEPFPCVRVDLYAISGKVYFGELTFTSLGGTMNFYTDAELLRMGQQIDLSGVKKIK